MGVGRFAGALTRLAGDARQRGARNAGRVSECGRRVAELDGSEWEIRPCKLIDGHLGRRVAP